jgi:DNA (cytosine-5)-methyltransferase 1
MSSNYRIPLMSEIKGCTKRGVTIISLFAGGGGSSTGYNMAGGTVLLANEFIPTAAKTYAANWPETALVTGDIRGLDPGAVLGSLGLKPGSVDILDGSPPCSGFSTAGKKEKGWGREKVYSGVKQECVENLFFEYIRFLTSIQPKVFAAENVPGLVIGKSKGYFNEILRGLRNSGYYVEAKILNGSFLGVPQIRKRLIFIGVRNDLFLEKYRNNLHPKQDKKIVSAGEALEGLELTEQEKEETDMRGYAVYPYLVRLREGQHNGSAKKFFTLSKLDRNKPSYTITASSMNGGACVYHWDNRALTVRELKRLMSVPDDYILLGSCAKQRERLGRMVPPFITKEVLENLISLGVFNHG